MNNQIDLFMSNKDRIYSFIESKGRCFTHEITAWGASHYCSEPTRLARTLGNEGKIWRMNKWLKKRLFPSCKEDIWSVNESDK